MTDGRMPSSSVLIVVELVAAVCVVIFLSFLVYALAGVV